jgi:PAS domain S-box-containing protein
VVCRQLDTLRATTRAIVADPRASGDGTAIFERYDRSVDELTDLSESLSESLDETIAQDVAGLSRLGIVHAGLVLLIAAGVALLVSRQRRVVTAKTQQAERLASIVDASVDAIVGKSVEGAITSWNPAAERLYGYRAEEIVGRHVNVLVPQDMREEELALLERVRRGEAVQRHETVRVHKNGSMIPVALTVSPIFHDNEVQAISSIGQDITEQKTKDAALEEAREDALEASRLKSEFLATMSHEIRTPMNGVIGLTSLLLETELDESQRQYAEGVAAAGEALLTVINDILDLSKLEAGKVDLELIDFDPRSLVEEVASLVAQPAHSKQLEVVAYCTPEMPQLLVGDPGRIRQILLNLASNAVKFTAAGEVAITARSIVDENAGTMIRFQVTDTGIGISAEAQHRLFESFIQADASTTRRFGGTGLGLAICRKLTEAMHGDIGVSSEIGAGSTFWFQIPLPVSTREPDAETVLSQDLLSNLNVLVVDDNATNRQVLKSQLSAWGMHPTMVEHPSSVIPLMRTAAASGSPYPIAVVDCHMPDLDGLQLARLISADPTLADTQLIMLTSTMQISGSELQEAGVKEWITKPVRSSELYDRLMRLMRPLASTPVPQRTPLASPPERPSRGRILVVEDNAVNQMVAEGVVTKLGYQVDIVANGAEALEAVTATSYTAVLMDCHMPVMDGFTATREIRTREKNGNRIPIIAMTAGAMSEDRDRCLDAGMDDYVSKPVNVAALQETLTRWIPAEGASTSR